MNKSLIVTSAAVFLLNACGTYAGSGAYTGSTLGSILGSAIGGISSGPRGSDVGTIVGMAGGAIIGGSIGAHADKRRQMDRISRSGVVSSKGSAIIDNGGDYNVEVFDPSNGADDRIPDFISADSMTDYNGLQPDIVMPAMSKASSLMSGYFYSPDIEVRNVRFSDENSDNVISRGELCRIVFELYNNSTSVIDNVRPIVLEATGNKHIFISQDVLIEHIAPGRGIRYTAMLKADNRLKNGEITICLSVLHGDKKISKVNELSVKTVR